MSGRDLRRSAEIRAAIVAFINNSPDDVLVTIKMVDEALKDHWHSLGYVNSPVEGSMHLLATSKMIKKIGRIKEGPDAGKAAFVSARAKLSQETLNRLTDLTPRKQMKPHLSSSAEVLSPQPETIRKETKQLADLTVDILKESGRVRLTIGGMVIDIGVM